LFVYLNQVISWIKQGSDRIAGFIVLAFLMKLLSKLIFGLAFVPIGTLTKFVVALLDISATSAALVYNSVSAVIEIIAFIFHRRFTKISEEMMNSKQFQKLKEKLESLAIQKRDHTKLWVQILEIFFIQNGIGIPDTATMLYYAVISTYSLFSFAIGTLLSYFSINLLKSYAWMIALRALFSINSFSYEDLSNIQSAFSPQERYAIIIVGSIGIIWLVFKVSRLIYVLWKSRKRKNALEPEQTKGQQDIQFEKREIS
jgi:hypothetical protein